MAKEKVTGSIGVEPPPDAPREVTQPLQPEAGGIVVHDPVTRQPTGEVVTPSQRARQNERELAPLKPPTGPALTPEEANARLKAMGLPPMAPMIPPTTIPRDVADAAKEFFGDDVPSASAPPKPVVENTLPPLSDEDRKRMPAASDSESPSKGLLPNLVPERGDKFEGIDRGGFGPSDSAGYYPLNGEELAQAARKMMADISDQMRNDLRFSIALTYPLARVTVSVVVEAIAEDLVGTDEAQRFGVEKIFAPKDGDGGSTAKDIAMRLGDRVVFVVDAKRQEFDSDGRSETPPDAIRDELGLEKPRMQMVDAGAGRQSFVDFAANSRAVTR